jgi:hypothetical protein
MKDEQWLWMMNYCKDNRLPPAQSWAWKRAKEAYIKEDKMKKQRKSGSKPKLSPIKGSRVIRKLFSSCPLSPGRKAGEILTRFNSEAAFFRACLGKQRQVRMYGTSKIRGLDGSKGKYNPFCAECKQSSGSRSGKVVIDLATVGVEIDTGMGVG